jgi:hypothetical protein
MMALCLGRSLLASGTFDPDDFIHDPSIRTGIDCAFRCACNTARLPATRVWTTQRAGSWGIEP